MNKQKEGTVYTPEKITNYISKATIEKYLLEKINNKFKTNIQSSNKLFERYIQKENNGQVFIDFFIPKREKEQFEYIFKVLKDITVLDPAVGSGHFLIAVLKIIEQNYFNLRSLGIINWSNYKIREYIISNNLFGVDIENEVIEITKHRLISMLSDLINNLSDHKKLPNINSNYRVGNAIIGFIRQSEITNPLYTNLIDCFYEEIKSVFQTHKELRKIKLTEKEKKAMLLSLKPFHWFYEFPEVILKGGFDVIIENPPYISNKQLSPLEKAIYQKRFKTPKGLLNTFGIFIERSIKLCHSDSKISYIVHKNIIRSNNYDLLRKYLLENTKIEEITDLGAGAFEFVTAETVIIIITARAPPEDHKILILANLPKQRCFTPRDLSIKHILQKTFLEQDNYNINLNLQNEELEIINYIKENKDCELKKYFEAKTCIATGDDEKFLADHKVNNSFKKTLRGKNIGRFFIDFNELYVNYEKKALHRARDEKIFQKPEKLIMQTIANNLTVAYDNKNYYPLSTCIAIIPKDDLDNKFSIKYLLLLMNSKLMNFYYDFVFNLGAHLTTEISVNNINRLPLNSLDNYADFSILADVMNRMNDSEINREENKDYIEFLSELINLLINEIVFFDKFQLDGLNTDLIHLISHYISNVKLHSIDQIQECIKNMQNDENIKIETNYIKKHPWVKIIEEYFR